MNEGKVFTEVTDEGRALGVPSHEGTPKEDSLRLEASSENTDVPSHDSSPELL